MLEMLQNIHVISGLAPVADALAGTVGSDVVDMSEFDEVLFVIHKGVGTTGTSTVTVEACDDVTPTTQSAIPFWYRAITTGDTHGALTAATSAGFALTAGSAQHYLVSVKAQQLLASGYRYVRLKAVEVVNDPVLAGILIFLGQPRYAGTHNSQID